MPFSDSIPAPADLVQQAREFQAEYFGSNLEGSWMCAFNGDPGVSPDWTGSPAAKVLDGLADYITINRGTPPNLYWSPYRYRGGGALRRSELFIEAVSVVVDDVGSQADVDELKRRFEAAQLEYREGPLAAWKAAGSVGARPAAPKRIGVKVAREWLLERIGPPTTSLETSLGNCQWFYRLDEPCRDRFKLSAILLAIDSDAKDLARIMRMPGGANWKASALVDGKPFVCRVLEEGCGRAYRIDDMLTAVGADVQPEVERPARGGGEEKPEFAALREAGLLLGSAATANPDTSGSYWMTCPGHLGDESDGGWPGAEIGHSAGMDAGRARVWPWGGFKCWHASCGERNFDDLCAWVARHGDAGPVLERLQGEAARAAFASPVPDMGIPGSGGSGGGGSDEDDEDLIGDDAPRVIRIRPGQLPFQVRELVKALRKRRPIYYFGHKTIQVIGLVERDGIGGKVRVAQLARLQEVNVCQRLLEGVVDWYKWNERANDYVPCNVTPRIAANICHSMDLDFEEIVGTIRAPFLRHDGTIGGMREGYDRKTGLWVDYVGVEYRPVVDAECTREGALAALERIKVPLSEYKFAPSADGLEATAGSLSRAVALAAMLTPVARPAVSQVPMFGIDAPERGSGKTKLALAVCALMTGLSPALVQGTADATELDKRVNAVLLTGEQLVVIDNIVGRGWGTSDLCAAITTDRVNIRPLGTSDSIPIRNGFILFITGNNIIVEGDISRRIVMCRIDPDVDRPENEAHSFDPVDYVKQHRAELVRDLLIVLRAYVLAGRPEQGGRVIGSFGGWARIVRDALMWLGEPDVTLAIDVNRTSNTPELEGLMLAWEKAFGTGPQTARKAKDLLHFENNVDPVKKAFGDYLHDNILSLGADRKTSAAGWLGTWLRNRNGQRAKGLKLQKRILDGNLLWYVDRTVNKMTDDDDDII